MLQQSSNLRVPKTEMVPEWDRTLSLQLIMQVRVHQLHYFIVSTTVACVAHKQLRHNNMFNIIYIHSPTSKLYHSRGQMFRIIAVPPDIVGANLQDNHIWPKMVHVRRQNLLNAMDGRPTIARVENPTLVHFDAKIRRNGHGRTVDKFRQPSNITVAQNEYSFWFRRGHDLASGKQWRAGKRN